MEACLNQCELDQFHAILLNQLEESSRRLETEIRKEWGEKSSEGTSVSGDEAELASRAIEEGMLLGRLESESNELHEVRDALDRLGLGVFGVCEQCDRPIARERLRAIPHARLCWVCKQQEEGAGMARAESVRPGPCRR